MSGGNTVSYLVAAASWVVSASSECGTLEPGQQGRRPQELLESPADTLILADQLAALPPNLDKASRLCINVQFSCRCRDVCARLSGVRDVCSAERLLPKRWECSDLVQ